MNVMPAQRIEVPIPAQRAIGRLHLGFRRDAASSRTRIQTLLQEGCLKARLPRPVDLPTCEAVTLNISGGVAGGDRLATAISLGAGADALVATQAAERVYRALDAPARMATEITIGPGAVLHHLPQETILFDGFALRRRLEIDLAEDASYLGVESLVFGRQAMGEAVTQGALHDRITLRRAGRLVFEDITRLHGDIAAQLQGAAVAGSHIAVAALLYAAPQAASCLDALREALVASGCEAGASAFDGIVFARLLAPSAASLRHCLQAAIGACRGGLALPRVWQI